jgi:4-hydroxybenzoate polyprenyltransferase
MKYAASGQPTETAPSNNRKVLSPGFLTSLLRFCKDIKIAHSVFALPFAASAVIMIPVPQLKISQIVFLLTAMIGARSFAMGMNRFLDRKIDGINPRTRQRQIPNGELSASHGLMWSLVSAIIFVASAFGLNTLSGILSIPVLFILCGYSYMKLLSWLTHWYLGFCLGMAPIAVSIALTGKIFPQVIAVGAAVMFWTAGFDILYALQDIEFDVKHRYHSVPAKFGARKSIIISQVCFAAMISALTVAGFLTVNSGPLYYCAVAAVAVILAFEHWLIRDVTITGKSSNINAAFFTANAWVSVIFYAVVQIEKLT